MSIVDDDRTTLWYFSTGPDCDLKIAPKIHFLPQNCSETKSANFHKMAPVVGRGILGFTLVLWKPWLSLVIMEDLLLSIAYLIENGLNMKNIKIVGTNKQPVSAESISLILFGVSSLKYGQE